jgi:hypothetical protein
VRGERAVSDGWLARARRLLEGQGRTAEQGWLALREGSFALPGDPVLARTRCAEAEALGRALGDIDLEMTALALGGLVRVSQGEIADGMARLDEATTAATAGEMRDPVAIGFSCCYLIFACERVRDFERAGQWRERVVRMTEEWSIRALRPVCLRSYWRGEYLRALGDDAIETFLREGTALVEAAPPLSQAVMFRIGQGVTAISEEATAFSHRDARYLFHPIVGWQDPSDDARQIAAGRAFAAAMRPYGTGAAS